MIHSSRSVVYSVCFSVRCLLWFFTSVFILLLFFFLFFLYFFFFFFLSFFFFFFFFSSRRRHTRWTGDWSSDVCSSDLFAQHPLGLPQRRVMFQYRVMLEPARIGFPQLSKFPSPQ